MADEVKQLNYLSIFQKLNLSMATQIRLYEELARETKLVAESMERFVVSYRQTQEAYMKELEKEMKGETKNG